MQGSSLGSEIAASFDSRVSGLLLQLLFVARLAVLTTKNLVGHGNLELLKGSCKGSFVTTHSLVGHKQGVSQKVVFNHRKFS